MRRDNKEIRGGLLYPMIEDLKTTITGKFMTQLNEQGIVTSNVHRNLPVKSLIDIVLDGTSNANTDDKETCKLEKKAYTVSTVLEGER